MFPISYSVEIEVLIFPFIYQPNLHQDAHIHWYIILILPVAFAEGLTRVGGHVYKEPDYMFILFSVI